MRKVELTQAQAEIMRDLYNRKQAVQNEMDRAFVLMGIERVEIVSGDMAGDAPHLMVKDIEQQVEAVEASED